MKKILLIGLLFCSVASATFLGKPVKTGNGGTSTNSSAATGIPHVASGVWTYSALVGADLPVPQAAAKGGVFSKTCSASSWISVISAVDGSETCSQPNFTDLAGSIAAGQIPSSTLTNSMHANMAAHTFKGNNTGSPAAPIDLTAAQLTAELNQFTSSLQGVVPSSSGGTVNFLRADGSWAAPATGLSSTLTSAHLYIGNGSNVATDTAVTGDVTISNSGVTAIGSNKVANSQLAQMDSHSFKGNNTGSTANALDLTATQLTAELNSVVGDSGSGGTKGLVPAPGSGDAAAGKFLKADGTFAVPSGASATKVCANLTTRDTATPTAAGHYRTMIKGSGTLTLSDTDGSGKFSSANGCRIYATNGTGAGTNTEPQFWQMYIGTGKNPVIHCYVTTGHGGIAGCQSSYTPGAANDERGIFWGYDEAAGIVTVTLLFNSSGSVNRAFDIPATATSGGLSTAMNIYFEIYY